MSTSIRAHVCDPVAQAAAGDALWYVYTGRLQAPLLLAAMDTEPAMPNLQRLLAVAAPSAGEPLIQGRARIADDGAVEVCGTDITPDMLPVFAGWVAANVGEHPALRRFSGTRFLRTGRGHRAGVEEAHDVPALWEGLSRSVVAGTMGQTLARMAAMRADDRAWLWLTRDGPGGRAHLHLALEREDPDCAGFKAEVSALRGRSQPGSEEAVGVLVRTAFLYTATSTAPIPGWGALLQRLLDDHAAAHPALLGLAATPLTYVSGGRISGFEDPGCVIPEGPDNLLRELSVLQHVRGEEPAWFWLTAADTTGHPRLLLARRKADLREAAVGCQGKGTIFRGTVRIQRGAPIEFHTRSPTDGFFAALTAWMKRHRTGWPVVRLLRRVVIIHHDADGTVLNRITR